MPTLNYVHVDVFSDRPFSGNSLAVFFDAEDLDANEMLRITQELRHFETVFLWPTAEPGVVRIRVFDLFEELPFAGHPLIGAAAVLQHRSGATANSAWHLVLPHRTVSVDVRCTPTGFSAQLDQGSPDFLGEVAARASVAEAFGLDERDLDAELPLEVASTGLCYLVVPLSPGAISRAKIREDITLLLRGYGAKFAVLLDKTTMEIRHWNNDGVIEDVATGSAAGVVGAYALKHDLVRAGESFVIHQGRLTGRPSRLYITVEGRSDAIASVKVGGNVALVGHGTLNGRPRASA
jgi:trans-2,3-dihydro-3-hydroxyanthranilate isomerase